MIILRSKNFTIQEGGPRNRSTKSGAFWNRVGGHALFMGVFTFLTTAIPGLLAGVGTGFSKGSVKEGFKISSLIIGGGTLLMTVFGAIWGAIDTLFDKKRRSNAEKEVTADTLIDMLYDYQEKYKDVIAESDRVNMARYINEDQDPKNFMVNISYSSGYMAMVLNNPSSGVLEQLNDSLDSMVALYSESDYGARQMKNGGYIVLIRVPDLEGTAEMLWSLISEQRVKINFLTQKAIKAEKEKFNVK